MSNETLHDSPRKRSLEEEEITPSNKRLHQLDPPPPPPPLSRAPSSPVTEDSPTLPGPNFVAQPTYSTESNKIVRIRALVSSKEAGIIIGKSGRHIAEIKEETGMKVTISPHLPGKPDRVLSLSGPLNALRKVVSIISERLLTKDENLSETTLRILIPDSRMGFVIGKSGSKIKEVQQTTHAKIFSQPNSLPNSNERVMTVSGTPEAIKEAVYFLGTLIGDHHDRPDVKPTILYDPAKKHYSRPGFSYQAPPNSQYEQQPYQGYDYQEVQDSTQMPPTAYPNTYGYMSNSWPAGSYENIFPAPNTAPAVKEDPNAEPIQQTSYSNAPVRNSTNEEQSSSQKDLQQQYAQAYSYYPQIAMNPQLMYQMQYYQQMYQQQQPYLHHQQMQQPMSQQITVPDHLVGNIIGRGGNKIKEIRSITGCTVDLN